MTITAQAQKKISLCSFLLVVVVDSMTVMAAPQASFLAIISLFFLFFSQASAFVVRPPPDTATYSFTATTTTTKTAMSATTNNLQEIEVVRQPDQAFLEKKGVFSWGTWGCDASTFPWTYDQNESCYLLKGQVTVTPTDGRQAVTFGKGDFVTFPAGMSCTWDVKEAVHKHFMFF